jgi:hypothetical protein
MRPRIRVTKSNSRRVLPERSRLTIDHTVAALRRSRQALVVLESQLGDLLARVRAPGAPVDGSATDRLACAKEDAVAAMASLGSAGALFG